MNNIEPLPADLTEFSDAELLKQITETQSQLRESASDSALQAELIERLDALVSERTRRQKESADNALMNGETRDLDQSLSDDELEELVDALEDDEIEIESEDWRKLVAGTMNLDELIPDDERGGHWVRFFDHWVYYEDLHGHVKRLLALKNRAQAVGGFYDPMPGTDLSDKVTWDRESRIIDEVERILTTRSSSALPSSLQELNLESTNLKDRIVFAIREVIRRGQVDEKIAQQLEALLEPDALTQMVAVSAFLIAASSAGNVAFWAAAGAGLLLMFGPPIISLLSAIHTLGNAEDKHTFESGIRDLEAALAELGLAVGMLATFFAARGGVRVGKKISRSTASGQIRGRTGRQRSPIKPPEAKPIRTTLKDFVELRRRAEARAGESAPKPGNIRSNTEMLRHMRQRSKESGLPLDMEGPLIRPDLQPPARGRATPQPRTPRSSEPTRLPPEMEGPLINPDFAQSYPIQTGPRGGRYQEVTWGETTWRRYWSPRHRKWKRWMTSHERALSNIGIRRWVKDMLRAEFENVAKRAVPEGWQWRHALSKRFARSVYQSLTEAQLIEIILGKLHKFRHRENFRRLDDTRSPWRRIEREHLRQQPGESPVQWRQRLERLAVDVFYNDPAYIWAGPGHYNMLLGRLISGGKNPILDLDLPFRWNMKPGAGPLGRYGPRQPYDIWVEAQRYMPSRKTIGPVQDAVLPDPPLLPKANKTMGPIPGEISAPPRPQFPAQKKTIGPGEGTRRPAPRHADESQPLILERDFSAPPEPGGLFPDLDVRLPKRRRLLNE